MKTKYLSYILFPLIFAVCVALFLWLCIPQFLLYQEQYQLFLFTGDYFAERLSMPGGLADYISEFIVQFYYIPLYGAVISAVLLTVTSVLSGLACRDCSIKRTACILSFLPAILCVAAMADENILFSFPAALFLTALFLYLDTLRRETSTMLDAPLTIAGFIMLYWFAGPVAFAYIPAVGILRRRPLAALVALAAAFILVWGLQALFLVQYPLSRLLLGINYDRIPGQYPAILFIIASLVFLIPLITLIKVKPKTDKIISWISAAVVIIPGVIFVPRCFNADKSRVFAYNSLVRQGRWNDILARAEKERPLDVFSLQAVNLALAMKGQLPDTMFKFDQKGIEGLISRDYLDNTSQLVTAEALFRLGLINVAFSTTFDLQEAIMNDRKSGRFMKRMAECMLINGNYKVAEKYMKILKYSLFYADWVEKTEPLPGNDAAVESHPLYGELRRNAFKKELFYSQPEVEKILAMLATESEGSNLMAWQYFMAAAMLKGDIPMLAGIYISSADKFGQTVVPRHVQEAIAIFWTMGHQSFDGIPVPISPDVQRQTIALAQTAMKYPDNPAAWQQSAPGSFGVYFLNLQRAGKQKSPSVPAYQTTHE